MGTTAGGAGVQQDNPINEAGGGLFLDWQQHHRLCLRLMIDLLSGKSGRLLKWEEDKWKK
jgi:hypothetical protein